MKIFPLYEGSFTIDKTKIFIPFDNKKENLDAKPTGSLLVDILPFVIITAQDVVLLDTGLGLTDENGNSHLQKSLQLAGINSLSVTKVLLSHLHKDHAGGISRKFVSSEEEQLSFPNATYYVQEKELEFAMEKGTPSYLPEKLQVLRNSHQVVWLQDDAGTIDDYIYYEVTAAHSPRHQVFWIKNNSEIIFFGGDDAPHLRQMKHRFVAKYDYNGKKASQLRQQWWKQGQRENWIFLFYHDSKNPVFPQHQFER